MLDNYYSPSSQLERSLSMNCFNNNMLTNKKSHLGERFSTAHPVSLLLTTLYCSPWPLRRNQVPNRNTIAWILPPTTVWDKAVTAAEKFGSLSFSSQCCHKFIRCRVRSLKISRTKQQGALTQAPTIKIFPWLHLEDALVFIIVWSKWWHSGLAVEKPVLATWNLNSYAIQEHEFLCQGWKLRNHLRWQINLASKSSEYNNRNVPECVGAVYGLSAPMIKNGCFRWLPRPWYQKDDWHKKLLQELDELWNDQESSPWYCQLVQMTVHIKSWRYTWAILKKRETVMPVGYGGW